MRVKNVQDMYNILYDRSKKSLQYWEDNIDQVALWLEMGLDKKEIASLMNIKLNELNAYIKQSRLLADLFKKRNRNNLIFYNNKLYELANGATTKKVTLKLQLDEAGFTTGGEVTTQLEQHKPSLSALIQLRENLTGERIIEDDYVININADNGKKDLEEIRTAIAKLGESEDD